jgi:hypothetical protein
MSPLLMKRRMPQAAAVMKLARREVKRMPQAAAVMKLARREVKRKMRRRRTWGPQAAAQRQTRHAQLQVTSTTT